MTSSRIPRMRVCEEDSCGLGFSYKKTVMPYSSLTPNDEEQHRSELMDDMNWGHKGIKIKGRPGKNLKNKDTLQSGDIWSEFFVRRIDGDPSTFAAANLTPFPPPLEGA
ncbi:unnamed protein product [Dovyalis caffra]|uniref:Uncharacterized protein n=1 Tax=Dovyalis caffra TaxID=77055 RepID=A0AAV1S4E0_9ROSI|nr:unnamed protein product [Dovyalis caffra]